jgi:hypothetical protein
VSHSREEGEEEEEKEEEEEEEECADEEEERSWLLRCTSLITKHGSIEGEPGVWCS